MFKTKGFRFQYFVFSWGLFSLIFLRWDLISLWALPISALSVFFSLFKLLTSLKEQSLLWKMATISVLIIPVCFFISYSEFLPDRSLDVSSVVRSNFIVIQGGGNPITNHHHSSDYQKYAADIVKVKSPLFTSKKDLFSFELEDFHSFNEKIYSPCKGVVLNMQNNFQNEPVYQPSKKIPSNSVTISCEGNMIVKMSHFNRNSITVKVDDSVEKGDFLGKIGNSGNSSEPHLHIQANDTNSGKSIRLSYYGFELLKYFPIKLF